MSAPTWVQKRVAVPCVHSRCVEKACIGFLFMPKIPSLERTMRIEPKTTGFPAQIQPNRPKTQLQDETLQTLASVPGTPVFQRPAPNSCRVPSKLSFTGNFVALWNQLNRLAADIFHQDVFIYFERILRIDRARFRHILPSIFIPNCTYSTHAMCYLSDDYWTIG